MLESLCEIECINNPEQEFILRKSLETQIEVINIQTKLIQKRSTATNVRNQSSSDPNNHNISIDQTDRTPMAGNADDDGKQTYEQYNGKYWITDLNTIEYVVLQNIIEQKIMYE